MTTKKKTKRTRRKTKSQRSSENQMNVDVSEWRYQVALVASGARGIGRSTATSDTLK
jgi:hypothetical protein